MNRKKYYRKENRVAFFNKMIEKFGDCCMICKEKVRNLVVDHDHKNGIMRGLLCYKHNAGLGMFDDDIEMLKIAIEYLSTFQATSYERRDPISTRPKRLLLKSVIRDILQDPTYLTDVQRVKALQTNYPLSFSAMQSRVSRERKKMRRLELLTMT